MPGITDWIMCGLTLIYVIATVAILWSNKRSADAATKQIDESKRIQEQNAALQLLEQRFAIYRTVSSWLGNAKIISTGAVHFKDSLPMLQSLIFHNAADNVSEKTRRIEILKSKLQMPMICVEDRTAMTIELNHLEQEIYLKKIASLSQELKIIELAEVCYSNIDYAIIKAFADAYIDAAVHIGDEIQNGGAYPYSNALSRCTQKMFGAQILEQMKEEMKEVRK